MNIIKRQRQSGRTTELIRYCIENQNRDLKPNKPYLIVVPNNSEKEFINREWNGAINARFFKIATFDECLKNPTMCWTCCGVLIDNLDICLSKYFGKVDLITTL